MKQREIDTNVPLLNVQDDTFFFVYISRPHSVFFSVFFFFDIIQRAEWANPRWCGRLLIEIINNNRPCFLSLEEIVHHVRSVQSGERK